MSAATTGVLAHSEAVSDTDAHCPLVAETQEAISGVDARSLPESAAEAEQNAGFRPPGEHETRALSEAEQLSGADLRPAGGLPTHLQARGLLLFGLALYTPRDR